MNIFVNIQVCDTVVEEIKVISKTIMIVCDEKKKIIRCTLILSYFTYYDVIQHNITYYNII